MIRDDQGVIAASVRYRVVYVGETLDHYEAGEAATAIERARANPPAFVMAQTFVVDDVPGVYREKASDWVKVFPGLDER